MTETTETTAPPAGVDDSAGSPSGHVLTYAGFWSRTGAILVDFLLMSVWASTFSSLWRSGLPDPGVIGNLRLSTLLTLVTVWGYFVVTTRLAGATLGKLALRLRVVTVSLGRPDWPTVLFREVVGRILVTASAFIGYLWAAFDPRKQGWHDKIADTLVVKRVSPVTARDPWYRAPRVPVVPAAPPPPPAPPVPPAAPPTER